MKHINLTKPKGLLALSKYMITQESNNYGDQILTLKVLVSDKHYKILAITSNPEGNWFDIKEMKQWFKNVIKAEKGVLK